MLAVKARAWNYIPGATGEEPREEQDLTSILEAECTGRCVAAVPVSKSRSRTRGQEMCGLGPSAAPRPGWGKSGTPRPFQGRVKPLINSIRCDVGVPSLHSAAK